MTDDRVEQTIAKLLRAGVVLSAAVVAAGGIWYLASDPPLPDYGHYHESLRGLQALLALPGPEQLIVIGLLVLVATPIFRVAFAVMAFALEGDRAYTAISALVLVLLLYSIATALL